MGKPLVALSAVHDIFARDHAGIAACSKLIRDALEKEPNLSDVERAISPSEIHPCMETAALRWIGLTANNSVLEMLVRYPRFALYRLLQQQWTMAAKGEPLHPYVRAVGAGFVIASPEFLDLVGETLGQLYWIARDCQRCVEFFEIERQMWAEASSLHQEQIAPTARRLAEPKVEQQRWVLHGIYDRSVMGIPQLGVSVESWATDITIQGLSGEQRHRLLKRYRENEDIFDFLDGVLFYCARDPLDPQQRFFTDLATVTEMRSTAARQLTLVALWLSGLVEGPESGPPRTGTDMSDLTFLLRVAHLAISDPATMRVRQNMVAHFLWRKKEYWESAPGPSLYGLLGTCLKRKWLNWLKNGTFEDDDWVDEYGHAHEGRQKQDLRTDEALDYIANREKIGPRSARRPDSSDYDGDVENAHGFYEWIPSAGAESFFMSGQKARRPKQVETEEYRPAKLQKRETARRLVNIDGVDATNDETAMTRRYWRNMWLYNRPSSLDLGDFEEWINPEIDIQRTFDALYGVTKPSPVLLHQTSTATGYRPNGFVRIGSRRKAERAKRDAHVYIMRTCEDADDKDIPLISELSEKEGFASVKNLSDDRNGATIRKALREGRRSIRPSLGLRPTGGAFDVPCAGRHLSTSGWRDSSPRPGPCIVTTRNGVKVDPPEVFQKPPKKIDL